MTSPTEYFRWANMCDKHTRCRESTPKGILLEASVSSVCYFNLTDVSNQFENIWTSSFIFTLLALNIVRSFLNFVWCEKERIKRWSRSLTLSQHDLFTIYTTNKLPVLILGTNTNSWTWWNVWLERSLSKRYFLLKLLEEHEFILKTLETCM